MNHVVFISYSSTNRDIARELSQWIQGEIGLPVFFDQDSIKLGHAWPNTIINWLEASFAVIVLVSKASMQSCNVTFEWSYAMGRNKYILPLVIEPNLKNEDINDFLEHTQRETNFVNPVEDDYEKLKARLLELRDLSNVPDEVLEAVKLARNPIRENQEHAVNLLKDYPTESALRELRILAKDPHLDYRQIIAAIALADRTNYDNDDPIEGLAKGIEQRVTSALEQKAINSLSRINSPNAADRFYQLFDKVQSFQRKDLVNALLEMNTENIDDIFLNLIMKGDVPPAFHMIRYLHEKRSPKSVDVIIEVLENKNWNNDTRAELYGMLPAYNNARVPSHLLKALDDNSNNLYAHEKKIIIHAFEGLIENATPELIEEVEDRNNRTHAGQLKRQYLNTLVAMRNKLDLR